jgi:hypothetical protein
MLVVASLQLNATTGGDSSSFSNILFDNIKIIDEHVLSVDENFFNAQNLKLFPNPALNTITLNNVESIALQQVSLYNLSGRLLQTVAACVIGTETTLDVSSLVTSTYIVVIQMEAGEIIKQFIKQ